MNAVFERFAVITVAASKGQPILLHNSNYGVFFIVQNPAVYVINGQLYCMQAFFNFV